MQAADTFRESPLYFLQNVDVFIERMVPQGEQYIVKGKTYDWKAAHIKLRSRDQKACRIAPAVLLALAAIA